MNKIKSLSMWCALSVAAVAGCGKKSEPPAEPAKTETKPETKPEAKPEARPETKPEEAVDPNLVTSEVTYEADGIQMKGYLVYDKRHEGKRPGVLVVHEWWGLNAYARRRARMLAELGYTALAVDMYGGGKEAGHPVEAGEFAQAAMKSPEGTKARFLAAMELLKAHETSDPERIAAIGYCFGGAVVLHMARFGVDLDGVVSFHGSLGTETPAKPGAVKARVLVLHGAADPFIPADVVDKFKQEMDAAKVDYRFEAYPGVTHSFTSPEADELGKKFDLPIKYDAEADRKSWDAMVQFFVEIFAK